MSARTRTRNIAHETPIRQYGCRTSTVNDSGPHGEVVWCDQNRLPSTLYVTNVACPLAPCAPASMSCVASRMSVPGPCTTLRLRPTTAASDTPYMQAHPALTLSTWKGALFLTTANARVSSTHCDAPPALSPRPTSARAMVKTIMPGCSPSCPGGRSGAARTRSRSCLEHAVLDKTWKSCELPLSAVLIADSHAARVLASCSILSAMPSKCSVRKPVSSVNAAFPARHSCGWLALATRHASLCCTRPPRDTGSSARRAAATLAALLAAPVWCVHEAVASAHMRSHMADVALHQRAPLSEPVCAGASSFARLSPLPPHSR